MLKEKRAKSKGVTIIELIITGVVACIVITAVGTALVDNYRGWHVMYNRVYSDVVIDGYVSRRMFDKFVRKASMKNIILDETGSQLELRYYHEPDSTCLDRYAYFYVEGDELRIEYGIWNAGDDNPKIALGTQTACSNVSSCVFTRNDSSIQMVLKLDNGRQNITIMSSAVPHN